MQNPRHNTIHFILLYVNIYNVIKKIYSIVICLYLTNYTIYLKMITDTSLLYTIKIESIILLIVIYNT